MKSFWKKRAEKSKRLESVISLLAAPDEKDFEKLSAPTLILAGNGLPILADKAAQMYVNGQVERLFWSAGWVMRLGSFMRILKSKDFILKKA